MYSNSSGFPNIYTAPELLKVKLTANKSTMTSQIGYPSDMDEEINGNELVPSTPSMENGSRFMTKDEMEMLLRAPVKAVPRKSLRREILLNKIKQEEGDNGTFAASCPERDDMFFDHPSTKRVGMVFIRPFKNKVKEAWYVYFMKLSFLEKKDGKDCSFFKIAFKEIPQVCDIISSQLEEIARTSAGSLTPRLYNSPFKNCDDRKNVTEFWSKAHTEYTSSDKFAIRQHMDMEGIWTIKFFQPKATEYEDWHGSTITMSLGHARTFVDHLMDCYDFICGEQGGSDTTD